MAHQPRIDRHIGLVHRGAIAVESGPTAQDPGRAHRSRRSADAPARAGAGSRSSRRSSSSRRPTPCRGGARRSGRRRRAGCPRERSCARIESLTSENTAMTPVGRRARTPSIQPRPGVLRPCISDRTTASWCRPATRSTPRTISSAHSDLELVKDDLEQRRPACRLARAAGSRPRGSPPRRGDAFRARRPSGR